MSNIKLFESQRIRSVWNESEQKWYFSVVDVVQVLTDSANPTDYLKKLRKREPELGSYLGTNCPQVAAQCRRHCTQNARWQCGTPAPHHPIHSLPSPKAEPFKRWLAKVGYERLEEIENPELAAARMRGLYQAKGYSDAWIEKRVRGATWRKNPASPSPARKTTSRCPKPWHANGSRTRKIEHSQATRSRTFQ